MWKQVLFILVLLSRGGQSQTDGQDVPPTPSGESESELEHLNTTSTDDSDIVPTPIEDTDNVTTATEGLEPNMTTNSTELQDGPLPTPIGFYPPGKFFKCKLS